MNCPKCNAHIDDDSVFCTECGERLEKENTDAPEEHVTVEGNGNEESGGETLEAPEAPARWSKAGKKAILFFISMLCIPACLVMFLLGFILLEGFSQDDAAIFAWIVGLIELQAFWILLLISSKLSPVPEEYETPRMLKTAKLVKAVSCAVVAVLLVSPFIYTGAVTGGEIRETKNSVVGVIFVENTTEDTYTEYEFLKGKRCIERTVSDTAYTPEVTKTEHKYSVKKTGEETFCITVDGHSYFVDNCEPGDYIDSFDDGTEFFKRRSDFYDEIEDNTYEAGDFISEYNGEMKSSSGKTSGTDEQYINAAKTVIYEAAKYPSTAVFNEAKVLERDGRGMAIVYVDVSSKNGFGNTVRDKCYVCIQEVVGDKYKASSYASYVTDESKVPYLKTANGYGYDPEAEKNKDIIVGTVPSEKTGVVTVGEYTLDKSTVSSTLMTMELYTVGEDKNVVAVSVKIPANKFENADSELLSKMITAVNETVVWGNIEIDKSQITEVFGVSTGPKSAEPLFLAGGYIIHAASDAQNHYYTVTFGRGLGVTEDDCWTPVLLLGSSGTADSDKSDDKTDKTDKSDKTQETKTPKDTAKADKTDKDNSSQNQSGGGNQSSQGAHIHSYVNHDGKAATCTESGYLSYKTCSCGYTDYKEIPAKGHDYALGETVQATCEGEGYTLYQCSGCSESYKDTIAAIGHSYSEATCAAPKTCSKCGTTAGTTLPHDMNYTKCRLCDYTDFSSVALTSSTFCLDSWFYLGDKYNIGDGLYLEDGEASISIDKNGVCKVTFDKYSYTFTLVQSAGYGNGGASLSFDCYMNGEYLENATVDIYFSQNRCGFHMHGGTLGFSQVVLEFEM